MAYSDFTLRSALDSFGLTLREVPDLFAGTPPVDPGPLLAAILTEFLPLGEAIGTEKARSEFLIAPLLAMVRIHLNHRVSVFSGIEFNVDPARGLNGFCDFLLSRSSEQLLLRAPVVVVVEAKNENLKAGLGQCAAVMVGAREYNGSAAADRALHGAVTSGSHWRFLRLDGSDLHADLQEYSIRDTARLFGVLTRIAAG